MGNNLEKELDLILREYNVDYSAENPGKINLFLSITPEIHYIIQIDFANYPEKSEFILPSDLYDELGNPAEFLLYLRDWSSQNPPHIIEVIHELEDILQNLIHPNDEMEELMIEFNARMIGPNRLQVSLFSYNKKIFEFKIVHKKPNPPSIYLSQELEQIIKPQELKTLRNWPHSRLIEICRELSRLIEHRTRILSELKHLDFKKEYKKAISKEGQNLIIIISIEIENGEICEIKIKLTEEFPLIPPDIELNDLSNKSFQDDINKFLLTAYNEWQPTNTLVEVLENLRNLLKRKSKNICQICHEYKCPICKKPLSITKAKGISGEFFHECRQQCSSCHTTFHRCCWDNQIKPTRKCPICLKQSNIFL